MQLSDSDGDALCELVKSAVLTKGLMLVGSDQQKRQFARQSVEMLVARIQQFAGTDAAPSLIERIVTLATED